MIGRRLLMRCLPFLVLSSSIQVSQAFTTPSAATGHILSRPVASSSDSPIQSIPSSWKSTTNLKAGGDEDAISINESDQVVLGVAGTGVSLVMMYSEFVLSQTGCGLPAGPFGLFGAVEGISYLSVLSLVAFSLYTKVKTGSGLPAGKYGLLGLAEGLAFLAVLAGVIVLGLQITNYGYIPNAVPMEGGMCS